MPFHLCGSCAVCSDALFECVNRLRSECMVRCAARVCAKLVLFSDSFIQFSSHSIDELSKPARAYLMLSDLMSVASNRTVHNPTLGCDCKAPFLCTLSLFLLSCPHARHVSNAPAIAEDTSPILTVFLCSAVCGPPMKVL